jgi:hypothetical protein
MGHEGKDTGLETTKSNSKTPLHTSYLLKIVCQKVLSHSCLMIPAP